MGWPSMRFLLIFAVLLAAVPGVEVHRPARIGGRADLPADGVLAWSRADGLWLSPLRTWAPRRLAGPGPAPTAIDCSEDGRWLLCRVRDAHLRPRLLLTAGDGSQPDPLALLEATGGGWLRGSPLGSEIFAQVSGTRLDALRLDLTGARPRILGRRILLDLEGDPRRRRLADHPDGRTAVAGGRIHLRLLEGASWRAALVELPAGGRGVATWRDLDAVPDRPAWECGTALSPDGLLACLNPGAVPDRDLAALLPLDPGHRGLVVHPAVLEPGWRVRDLYLDRARAVCWAPGEEREADWGRWWWSDRREWIAGCDLAQAPGAGGIWLLDWTRGLWVQVAPAEERPLACAVRFQRPDESALALPVVGSATAAGPGWPPPSRVLAVLDSEVVVPSLRELSPYDSCLAWRTWRIEQVLAGPDPGPRVVVGQLAVRHGQRLAPADWRRGRRQVLTLDAWERQVGLESLCQVEAEGGLDLPYRYCVDAAEPEKP